MADADPFARIATFFDDLVAREDDEMRALDYGGRASQQLRFDVLDGMLPFEGARVLDVGCGLAHLADDLEARGRSFEYLGIDLSPRMVDSARARRPDLDLRTGNILEADPGGPFDVVVANGIFYVLGERGPELMRALVARMWELAFRAVGFTSLSTWSPVRSDGEFHAEPLETLAFCRTLTSRVAFRHDYLAHDFAVALLRDAS